MTRANATPEVPLTPNRSMQRLAHEGLTRLGFDPDRIQREALQRAGADHREYWRLAPIFWSDLSTITGDAHIGLHLAETVPTRLLDEVALMMYLSLDLRNALQRLVRFQHLLSGGFRCALQCPARRRDAELVLDLAYPGFGPLRQQAESLSLLILKLLALCTDGQFRLSALEFRHPAPEAVSEHLRLFGVQPRFEHAHDRLFFPASLLDMSLPAHNPELLADLESLAEERLRRQKASQFLFRVRSWIDAHLDQPEQGMDDCARDFGLSRIALRRNLAAHNAGFEELRDELRRQRAANMLSRGDGLSRTAQACGFSSYPRLREAFESWFGCSPERFQAQQEQPGTGGQGRET